MSEEESQKLFREKINGILLHFYQLLCSAKRDKISTTRMSAKYNKQEYKSLG